jgi:CheY-like chemotaxis protein
MDIQMPNMNGIDATKEIRSQGIKVPIIAQTANILAEDKSICIEAGCDDYIGKPINASELIEVVKHYI